MNLKDLPDEIKTKLFNMINEKPEKTKEISQKNLVSKKHLKTSKEIVNNLRNNGIFIKDNFMKKQVFIFTIIKKDFRIHIRRNQKYQI
jgi:hypothetical protein